jgi:hypothetical protein
MAIRQGHRTDFSLAGSNRDQAPHFAVGGLSAASELNNGELEKFRSGQKDSRFGRLRISRKVGERQTSMETATSVPTSQLALLGKRSFAQAGKRTVGKTSISAIPSKCPDRWRSVVAGPMRSEIRHGTSTEPRTSIPPPILHRSTGDSAKMSDRVLPKPASVSAGARRRVFRTRSS